ncbi:MAG: InlB B-repeat-containing protein, partial [archaeon]|nr:InlB B-repeat-containing protein [archaeon]
KYKVTYHRENGSFYTYQNIGYDMSAVRINPPAKEPTAEFTYEFMGWSISSKEYIEADLKHVRTDMDVYPFYTAVKNTYTVRFLDDDGTFLGSSTVEYGSEAVCPVIPYKEPTAQYTYTFEGWDSDISRIVGDMTVKAVYGSTVNVYTVTFVDDDGTVLKTERVEFGKPATAPADPVKAPTAQYTYEFAGWDVPFTAVTGDLKVTATYRNVLNEYLLTFVSEGKTVGSKYMPYGSRSDAVGIPVPTAPAGKKFSAWNGLGTTVTKDMVLTAVFVDDTETLYTVTYLNHDGSIVHTDKVTYGQPSVYSEKPTRASTAQYSFSFRGWSSDKATYIPADLTRITEDVTVYAFYDGNVRSYNVTFVDYDGYVLASMTVEYGKSATAPADPYRAPTAEYTYTFKGWDSDYSDIRGDTVVKAVYDRTVNFYKVVFVDFDGSILKKDSVGYGGYAIAPVDPVRERTPEFTYTFVGWSDSDTVFSPADLSSISYDRTVYAWYFSERNSYTVTFVNDDGSVLKTETVVYGQPATAPADPSKEPVAGHTYTFVGWDVPFDMITGDLVVTAVFSDTEILYTVTFMDGNEVLKSEKVTYGSSVTAPAAPHREPTAQYTFGFVGWSLSTTEFVKAETDRITGNVTAYAYFEATVNEYTVQFMVDGSLYSSCTVPYGSPATAPADPVKEPTAQYTFTFGGWSTVADRNVPADLSSVKGDMTVHAYFGSTVNVYTVTFEVEGETYAVKTLGYGSTVDASGVEDPVPPVGMRFKGWEGVGATVTCDMTVKASFVYDDVTLYNVTYMDGETVLFVDRVTYGTDSVYGEKPVKVPTPEFSYTFRGWSALAEVYTPAVLTGITEDVTVYAWYDEVRNTYTVTFLDDDGTFISKETVEYGSAAIGPEAPYKEPTAQYTYFFTGWDSDIGCVKENMEVKAVYDAVLNSYTVTFVAGSETVGTKVFDYGMAMSSEGIVTPDAPAGKKFVGWEGEGTPVTGDMTVYALFVDDTETLYTVTYIGADGETLHTESMTYGKPATYSSVPAKEPTAQYVYTFRGWSVSQEEFSEADLSSVTCDVTVYAWFSETVRSYGVSFVDDKGHTFYTCTVLYGQPADVPEAPAKESTVSTVYTFRGWSTLHGEYSEADLSCIVGDTVVYAWYYDEVREYTVTYMSGETLFAVRSVPYNGSVPTDVGIPEAPSGYVFDRWDGSEKTVVSDMTVTAVFSVKEVTFTVVYKNENGTTLWTEIVDAGGSAKYDVVPVKEDTKEHTYTFVGWDHDLTDIHSNLTVYPVFEEKPRMYNVLFFDWDKTLIGQDSVAYGDPVDVPEAPGRDSTVQYVYTFHGWSTMPSQYNPATLDSVTGSMTVYAYYLKSFREYDVEFMDGEVSVGHTSVRYQGTVDERLAFTLMEGYGLRFFLDKELTKEAGAGYQILGDTVFYVKKYIGDYTLVGTNVTVSLDDKMVSSVSGTFEIDASQTGSVKNVTMPADTVALLNGVHGGCMVKITLPRGSMTMTSEELYALSNGSLGTSGGMDITVNISAGRVTAAITKAMGERNYTGVYYVSVNVGSAVVTDLDEKGMTVEVSLPLSLSEGRDDAAVWHIATGNVVENVDCMYRNGSVTFTASSLGNFCIGTVNAPDVKDKVVVPYGEIAVDKDGNLVSLSVDNHGEVLFVPSYHNDVRIISVASGAFKGLENAPMVVLPESVKKFDWSSLDGTSVLEVVFLGNMPEMTGTAPSKVTVYRASTASGWDEYYAEVLDVFTRDFDTCSLVFYVLGDYAVLKSGKNGSNINIPEYIPYNGKNVKVRYIGDSAFANNTYVSQVIIPDSVTDIMTRAFYNSWVKKIVFGDSPSVEHIWDGAFTGCNRLTNISLPDTMLFIGGHAFEGCSLFTRIAMPDGVQVIGEYAFAECTDLQKVSLGSSLLYVSEGCFHGDRQLDSATLPKTVTYIGDRAFEGCISLPSIDIANSVTVGKEAFKGCKVMEYATFGKDLVSLGEDSFKECPKLTEIDAYGAVPAGMDKAFDDPMALEFYVTAVHLEEWSVYHAELMESEKTYEEDKGDGMLYVVIAMIVAMVAIGVVSLRVRKNMR